MYSMYIHDKLKKMSSLFDVIYKSFLRVVQYSNVIKEMARANIMYIM